MLYTVTDKIILHYLFYLIYMWVGLSVKGEVVKNIGKHKTGFIL